MKQNRLYTTRRVAFTLLLLLGMVMLSVTTALAEPNIPEASAPHKASAVQLYTVGVQMAPVLPDLLGFLFRGRNDSAGIAETNHEVSFKSGK